MKIKNIKYYSTALLLATTLSFTSCGAKGAFEDKNIKIEEMEIDNSNDSETGLDNTEITSIIRDINSYFNYSIIVNYYSNSGVVVIRGPWENQIIPELTDELYGKFNLLLEQPSVSSLEIHRLDAEIDFSKLNLTNIKNITFDRCKSDFDYEPFKSQTYENIAFENTPAQYANTIVEKCCSSNTTVNYIDIDNQKEVSDFIKSLANNSNISLNGLYVTTNECTKEDYDNFAKVNAGCIDIMFFEPSSETYNLELYPNSNIKDVKIWCAASDIEFGNIKVVTDCPMFEFTLNGNDSRITENTHFMLPNESSVSISAFYDSGNSLKELANVAELSYYDYAQDKEIYYFVDYNNFNRVVDDFLKSKQYQKELHQQ